MQRLAQPPGEGSALAIDRSTRKNVSRATENGPEDPTYAGLVALMGSYIAGEQGAEPDDMGSALARIRMSNPDGWRGRNITHSIDAEDLRSFIDTGKITDAGSLGYIDRDYGNLEDFVQQLRESVTTILTPSAAKLRVPILSRSSLAELRRQPAVPARFEQFLTDILAAAGNPELADTAPLFPLGIGNPKQSRTVEANPAISVGDWVRSVFDGQNLTFTDETKDFEIVGPATGGCLCPFRHPEKGRRPGHPGPRTTATAQVDIVTF